MYINQWLGLQHACNIVSASVTPKWESPSTIRPAARILWDSSTKFGNAPERFGGIRPTAKLLEHTVLMYITFLSLTYPGRGVPIVHPVWAPGHTSGAVVLYPSLPSTCLLDGSKHDTLCTHVRNGYTLGPLILYPVVLLTILLVQSTAVL